MYTLSQPSLGGRSQSNDPCGKAIAASLAGPGWRLSQRVLKSRWPVPPSTGMPPGLFPE